MSRIGIKPITFPKEVTISLKDGVLIVKGPKGELSEKLHPYVSVKLQEGELLVQVGKNPGKSQSAMWGTFAALIRNMIKGVVIGFEKKLEINGVGYGWQVSGQKVTVKAGYSHSIEVILPSGISAKVEEKALVISGPNKQIVGETAANIRKIRLPEPYKGTGIKYQEEQIQRKAGKQAAGAGA
ncbi:MAG: 50S ribosomal protein L6 [Candidatus Kerfeldbacteria bacterium RIFOXYA2_FULL_38_24]|uniref:50S ribosomal protein L6 n=1 Tax=Candidatus Kerfeldbacteria bacterium RIFOXYB2_FULL_38_14 TaxID=1798547 RepID=A0A1G2BGT7_9BACT|nr:MAG: 50S ribosomal protein L6 [Candidatus Kerfeldbacteria bacterium RIFOXYB2_FULL_38_14]OGY87939.1 MAG: 50S ribosomal protein L6 [Candidatus Kerfeldbacteria bacterium RIFOXYA2_FULL_38_24]OGY88649.1 MAG: 50S ribosomal protein L6 [Candidatus Kerfeldbacteria bacterium RIFOXYC2_FULL_38_9]